MLILLLKTNVICRIVAYTNVDAGRRASFDD